MPGLNRAAQRFLDDYRTRRPEIEGAANLAQDIISQIVKESGTLVHVVSARAKSIDSLRGKFREKQYKRPASEITDLIGVRVITYYRDQVDPVVKTLQSRLEIDSKKSVDKRLDLGLRDFGYTSVHLIARVKPAPIANPTVRVRARPP